MSITVLFGSNEEMLTEKTVTCKDLEDAIKYCKKNYKMIYEINNTRTYFMLLPDDKLIEAIENQ